MEDNSPTFCDDGQDISEEDVLDYAKWLGIDVEKDPEFLSIARESLTEPLPQGWKMCQTGNSDVFYFNFNSGKSTWDHPCDGYYKRLFNMKRCAKYGLQFEESPGEDEEIVEPDSVVAWRAQANTKVNARIEVTPGKLPATASGSSPGKECSGSKRQDVPSKKSADGPKTGTLIRDSDLVKMSQAAVEAANSVNPVATKVGNSAGCTDRLVAQATADAAMDTQQASPLGSLHIKSKATEKERPITSKVTEKERAGREAELELQLREFKADHKRKVERHRKDMEEEFELQKDAIFNNLNAEHERKVREEKRQIAHKLRAKIPELQIQAEHEINVELALQANLREAEAEIVRLKEVIANAEEKVTNLTTKQSQNFGPDLQEINKLRDDLRLRSEEVERLHGDLTRRSKENDQLRRDLTNRDLAEKELANVAGKHVELDKLRTDLQLRSEEVENLSRALTGRSEEIDILQRDLTLRTVEATQLRNEKYSAPDPEEIAKMFVANRAATSENEQLRAEMAENAAIVKRFEVEHATLVETFQAGTNKNEKLQAEISANSAENAAIAKKHEIENATAGNKIQAATTKKEELQMEIATRSAELAAATKLQATTAAEHESAVSECNRLRAIAAAEHESAVSECNRVRAAATKLQATTAAEHACAESECHRLRVTTAAEHESAVSECNRLRVAATKLQATTAAEHESAVSECNRLRAEIASRPGIGDLDQKNAEIRSATSQLEFRTMEFEQLRIDMSRCTAAESTLALLEAERSAMTKEVDARARECGRLRAELAAARPSLQANCTLDVTEIVSLRAQVSALEAENKKFRQHFDTIAGQASELNILRDQLQDHAETILSLRVERSKVFAEQMTANELQTRLKSAKAEVSDFRSELRSHTIENSLLRAEVNRSVTQEEDVASMSEHWRGEVERLDASLKQRVQTGVDSAEKVDRLSRDLANAELEESHMSKNVQLLRCDLEQSYQNVWRFREEAREVAELKHKAQEFDHLQVEFRCRSAEVDKFQYELRAAEMRCASRQSAAADVAKATSTEQWRREFFRWEEAMQNKTHETNAAKETAERLGRDLRRVEVEEHKLAKRCATWMTEVEGCRLNSQQMRDETAEVERCLEHVQIALRGERTAKARAEGLAREAQREIRTVKEQVLQQASETDGFATESRKYRAALADCEYEVARLQENLRKQEDEFRLSRGSQKTQHSERTLKASRDSCERTLIPTGSTVAENVRAGEPFCSENIGVMQALVDSVHDIEDRSEPIGHSRENWLPKRGEECTILDESENDGWRQRIFRERVALEDQRRKWTYENQNLRKAGEIPPQACDLLEDRADAFDRSARELRALDRALHEHSRKREPSFSRSPSNRRRPREMGPPFYSPQSVVTRFGVTAQEAKLIHRWRSMLGDLHHDRRVSSLSPRQLCSQRSRSCGLNSARERSKKMPLTARTRRPESGREGFSQSRSR